MITEKARYVAGFFSYREIQWLRIFPGPGIPDKQDYGNNFSYDARC